ncbi:MAG: hypothetical protein E6J90_41630 [Deltaproteobacteria bacterium]|nr:MAG: hypothetical protein E6J91_40230 [Deltaproteobacteria bacterium]TMQ08008.1 MAG: hypothetical protein E6J90_41630 [Deltaproteobacteria bacterium]
MMDFTFPEYPEPTPLDAQRSWTATFDSHDQRNDDVYYMVTIHEAGREVARFMVHIFPYWAGDDWRGQEFVDRMRKELGKVAATGKTNTSYTGGMSRPDR